MAHLPVYLIEFSCFNAPEELRVDYHLSEEAAWKWKVREVAEGASELHRRQLFLTDYIFFELDTAYNSLEACI